MSIEAQTWRWTYQPNGITTQFAFDNLVLSADELIVKWWSVAGVELALPAHSVTGLGESAGGYVVFDTAPATVADSILEIIRKTTPLQETEFEDFIQESAAARQERSDRQFALAQELRGLLDRALLFSPLDPAGPFRIPAPSVRAGKALMFGAGPLAQLTVGSPLAVGSLVVSAFVETLLDDNDADAFLGTLSFSAFVKSLKAAVDGPAFRTLIGAVGGEAVITAPQGRLTLATGEAVMTSDQAGKTVLYYTPAVGGVVPIWNGTAFVPTAFDELANDLTLGASGAGLTAKSGPAAAGPYQVIDAFVWDDGGTVRETRGPKWLKSSTVTMTIATPCVVTWANHGLHAGATMRFSTTGALPTGLAVATDYFVTPIDANTFNLSTTLANQVAGTRIATSGAQGGVHTGENYTTSRGAGAGTAELELLNGIRVNKYDIVNGPAARRGTWVGNVLTNSASQIDFKRGALAVGGGEAIIGLWNAYNRVRIAGSLGSTTDTWTYNSATPRPPAGSATIRLTWVAGLPLEPMSASYKGVGANTSNNSGVGVGFNSTSAFSGLIGWIGPDASGYTQDADGRHSALVSGSNYMTALEAVTGSTTTFSGDSGSPAVYQSGFQYEGTY